MTRNWIDLPNSADHAELLVRAYMPIESDSYFCCAHLRGRYHDFWSVNIHGDGIVSGEHGDSISEALTKAVNDFWGKYHDRGDAA